MMKPQLFQHDRSISLVRLDPRTKLVLLLVINIFMISRSDVFASTYIRPLLAAIPCFLLLTGGRGRAGFIYGALFTLAFFAQIYFYPAVTGIVSILLHMIVELLLRFVPGLMMAYYLLSSTRVGEFVAAMERMRVPQKITIPLSVMFRFFPTIAEESGAIGDAMRMRGVGLRKMRGNPTAMLEYRMVPLMISVAKIGNDLSAAALTRGLGRPVKRTNICRVGFGFWDLGFFLIMIAVITIYVLHLGGFT